MVQTFRDDILEGGVKHGNYRGIQTPEVIYRVLDLRKDKKTDRGMVLTTRGERMLDDCLDDERYFIKNPR